MTIGDQIRDEKLQYDNNREAAKIALSSGDIDKYEYLTGEEHVLVENELKKLQDNIEKL